MIILNIDSQINKSSSSTPYRIHLNFLKKGYESIFLTSFSREKNLKNVLNLNFGRLSLFLNSFIRNILFGKIFAFDKYYFYPQGLSFRLESISSIKKKIKVAPDVIIFYWFNFVFSYNFLYKLSKAFPLAKLKIYLLDDEPYTGGCHISFTCNGFSSNCMNCPAIKKPFRALQLANKSLKFKQTLISKVQNLEILCASSFSYSRAISSSIFRNSKIKLVLFPLDEDIFFPIDRIEVRKKYELLNEKVIILFGAASISRTNKGSNLLLDALILLSQEYPSLQNKLQILIIGNSFDSKVFIPFPYKYLGFINNNKILNEIYNLADLLVIPSIHDMGPVMINEALLSGCPVVSFKMGVSTDLILDGKNGYISKNFQSKSIAENILKFIDLDDNLKLSFRKYSRKIALEKTSIQSQLEKVIS